MENKTINLLKKCPRFGSCSANVCPICCSELEKRLSGEESCRFTIKKKDKGQRGINTIAPACVLEVIPESNTKMLNKRNLKRWQEFHKTNGK